MPLSQRAPSERATIVARARPLLIQLAKRMEIIAAEASDRDALAALADLLAHLTP